MNSPNSTTGTSPSVAPPTRSFNVLLADGSRLRVTCRDLAAQLRQERTATLKRLRQGRAEALADIADRIGEARIRREFEANQRAMDAAIRRLSKQVRVRPEPRRSSTSTWSPRSRPNRTDHSGAVFRSRATSALSRPDRLGREGIMLRIRYVRAGGKHASVGCLRRHWRYIAREAAVTLDGEGEPIVLSNLGDDIDEVANALNLQEQVLREMRKNAKLGFRMIGAFPYGLPVEARREVLHRLGDELFGARDLPWSAAAHDADPAANVDNPHFHLDYGLLPMVRQADGSFIISNDLRTDLDGQEGLRFIRHTVARVMTEVAQQYGLDRTFTALSYHERGMDREGGEHIGQEGTAAHRRGEHVATIARNEVKGRLAEAREKARRARERLNAFERLKQAITVTEAAPLIDAAPVDAAIDTAALISAAPAIADNIPQIDTLAASPAPSLPPIPAVIATAAAHDGKATETGVAPPPTVTPAGEADHIDDPPIVSSVGSGAPVTQIPASLAAIGIPPPRMAAPVMPHADARLAPIVEEVIAMKKLGREAPAMAMPPEISRLSATAPRLAPTPSLWRIGQKPSDDAADRDTVRLIEKLLREEEKRRRDAGVNAPVQSNINTTHAAAFEALRLRDEWLGRDEHGRYTVSDEALHATGLARDDLVTPAAQAALEEIGFGQVDRFDPVLNDQSGDQVFQVKGGVIRLDGRFPAALRNDVARWSDNLHFRAFVGQVWPEIRPALDQHPGAPVLSAVTTETHRQHRLEQLFDAIACERHYLAKGQGVRVVDPKLLARFHLAPDDVAGDEARKRLADIAEQQAAEVSQIAAYVRRSPHHIVSDGEGWLLEERAPAHIRNLVAVWRNDATMQRALGRVAGVRSAEVPQAEAQRGVRTGPFPERPGAAWRRGRALRERAMAASDAMERLDDSHMPQPGQRIERPGTATTTHTVGVAWSHVMQGAGRD